jgi:hypothetical protein
LAASRLFCLLGCAFIGVSLCDGGTPAGDSLSINAPADAGGDRYGLFGWLDHRSSYGVGVFPEPFLVDDSDLEVNEFRLDLLHTGMRSQHSDLGTMEVEKGFGELTLEIEIPYERTAVGGAFAEGMANVNLGARYPIYQYVAPSGSFDTTSGVAVEVGIPTHSTISKNAELVPKVFNDSKLGNFTLQSVVGYSMLYGGGDERGIRTFEYGFVFGYTIEHKVLPIPNVRQLIPVFELQGATQLNKDDPNRTSLTGNLGFRVNTKAIGGIQPRLGLGYIFPIDAGARQDLHWGVFTSLVFEF